MANSIGSLSVKLGLSSAGFTSGLSKAAGAAKSFGASVTGIYGKIAGLGALVGGGGLGYMIGSAFKRMDEAGKASDKVGMATEAFVGLSYAAKLADIEQEAFTTSLQRMAGNIGLASAGMKEQIDSLRMLGLSMAQLKGMSGDQQFYAIADAIGNLGTVSEQTAAAMRVFGRGGVQLVQFIGQGTQAMRDAAAQAKALGATFDRSVAAKAEAVNDSFNTIGLGIGGIMNSIATGLAPAIFAAQQWFIDLGKSGVISTDNIIKSVEALAQKLVVLGPIIDAIGKSLKVASNAIVGTGYIGDILSTEFNSGYVATQDRKLQELNKRHREAIDAGDTGAAAQIKSQLMAEYKIRSGIVDKMNNKLSGKGASVGSSSMWQSLVGGDTSKGISKAIADAKAELERLGLEAQNRKPLGVNSLDMGLAGNDGSAEQIRSMRYVAVGYSRKEGDGVERGVNKTNEILERMERGWRLGLPAVAG